MNRKITEQELIEAVAKSKNFRQVLIALKLDPKGGNYNSLRNRIKRHALDTSHFNQRYLSFHKRYPYEQLLEAVKSCYSISELLAKFGVAVAGGNAATLKKAIQHYGIDTSHFTGKSWNKGLETGPRTDISEYLSNKVKTSSHQLRLRLLKEGIFEHKCYKCSNSTWLGNPIPLELEHIDGNNLNNNLTNLTLLCPNCHSLTPTFRGKNIGQYN